MDRKRILIVDDEESICEILKFNLEQAGYAADAALSAEEALGRDITGYRLIILDVMMDGISGFQLARIIKGNPATKDIPIIFCTAKDSEDDTVYGLETGADDYIPKPFSIKELTARVNAVMRRSEARGTTQPQTHGALQYKTLTIDRVNGKALMDGHELPLTRKELGILSLLMQKRGSNVTREELLKAVWTGDVCVADRTVDVHITRLRKKIAPYGKNIVSRQGYGYSFKE